MSFLFFFLSFIMIVCQKVWKKIVKILRRFLWGSVKGESNISRVKWDVVSKSKKLNGLGVHDLWLVNLTFLDKRGWRLLSGASGIWRDILTARYGVAPTSYTMGGELNASDLPRLDVEGPPFWGSIASDTSV